jgi:hypothetical protein
MVGTSGKDETRFAPVVAKARSLPSRIFSSVGPTSQVHVEAAVMMLIEDCAELQGGASIDAGLAGEQGGGKMREAGEAGGAIVQLARLGLGQRHKLGDIFRRNAGIEYQYVGRGSDHRDRLEVHDRS